VKVRNYKYLLVLAIGFAATVAVYVWFIHSPFFPGFTEWTRHNIVLFDLFLISIKIVGIVWPPITGAVFTVGAIPVLGWPHAFVVDSIGNIIGSSLAFWIAKTWGLKFVSKIVDEATLNKLRKIELVPQRQIEALTLLRVLGGYLAEVISYAAGLFNVSFRNFLIATILSNFIAGIPFFYFAGRIFSGGSIIVTVFLVAGFISIFLFLRKRYFRTIG
jgi:uncharacterized membrane protein YdjX (TVP38/TMEM64 family)